MKIATKLIVFFSAVLAVFVVLCSVLTFQVEYVTKGYDALLNTPVRQMEMARIIQVDFKKQVQEWKDILLRGHNPEDLAKYTKQFKGKEADVDKGARALGEATQKGEVHDLVAKFLTAHAEMGSKYQAAYDAYVASKFDFKVADQMVRGQDRAATDLFDDIVKRLDTQVKNSVAAQQAVVRRTRTLALAASTISLFGLGFLGLIALRGVQKRLERLKAVADRLAVADIDGLSIDISGRDEIGVFGESLKGVRAAIEELTKAASVPIPQ